MAERGRPTKLTPELANEIVGYLEKGNYPHVAAAACGINRTTLYKWMTEGARAKSGIRREFADKVKRAIATGETKLAANVEKAGYANWQASMTMLERRWPHRWARKDFLNVQADIRNLPTLSDDRLRQLAAQAIEVVGESRDIEELEGSPLALPGPHAEQ